MGLLRRRNRRKKAAATGFEMPKLEWPRAGRFAGAGITFIVGAGVHHFQTVGIPVALTSLAFVLGLLLLPFGLETKGKPLPT